MRERKRGTETKTRARTERKKKKKRAARLSGLHFSFSLSPFFSKRVLPPASLPPSLTSPSGTLVGLYVVDIPSSHVATSARSILHLLDLAFFLQSASTDVLDIFVCLRARHCGRLPLPLSLSLSLSTTASICYFLVVFVIYTLTRALSVVSSNLQWMRETDTREREAPTGWRHHTPRSSLLFLSADVSLHTPRFPCLSLFLSVFERLASS